MTRGVLWWFGVRGSTRIVLGVGTTAFEAREDAVLCVSQMGRPPVVPMDLLPLAYDSRITR